MIGLDISDRSVKMVQLSDGSPRRLLSHCWHAVPDGVIDRGMVDQPQALNELLLAVFEQCRLLPTVNDSVVASIPEAQSFMRVIEIPIMSEDEIAEAVQWQVAQDIPFGLENVYIDWQPIKSGHKVAKGNQEVLVGAAQKRVADPLVKVLDSIGVDLAALELESQAIVRALVSPELLSHQGLLLVDVGGTSTNVVVHDHGATRFSASLQYGAHSMSGDLSASDRRLLDVPRHSVLSAEKAEGVEKLLRPAQEELVTEIKGVVEYYNSIDKDHRVKEVLLTGGGSNFPGLDKVFLQLFNDIHVQRGNPWVNLMPAGETKEQGLSIQESVHFSTSIGLALRSMPY